MRPLSRLAAAHAAPLVVISVLTPFFGATFPAQARPQETEIGEFGRWSVLEADNDGVSGCSVSTEEPGTFFIATDVGRRDGPYRLLSEMYYRPASEEEALQDAIRESFSPLEARIRLVHGGTVSHYDNITIARRDARRRKFYVFFVIPGAGLELIRSADEVTLIYDGDSGPEIDLTDSREAFDLFLACVDGKV